MAPPKKKRRTSANCTKSSAANASSHTNVNVDNMAEHFATTTASDADERLLESFNATDRKTAVSTDANSSEPPNVQEEVPQVLSGIVKEDHITEGYTETRQPMGELDQAASRLTAAEQGQRAPGQPVFSPAQIEYYQPSPYISDENPSRSNSEGETSAINITRSQNASSVATVSPTPLSDSQTIDPFSVQIRDAVLLSVEDLYREQANHTALIRMNCELRSQAKSDVAMWEAGMKRSMASVKRFDDMIEHLQTSDAVLLAPLRLNHLIGYAARYDQLGAKLGYDMSLAKIQEIKAVCEAEGLLPAPRDQPKFNRKTWRPVSVSSRKKSPQKSPSLESGEGELKNDDEDGIKDDGEGEGEAGDEAEVQDDMATSG